MNYQFYAVCDGHGTNGHFVSGALKKILPSKYIVINCNLLEWLKKNLNLLI